MFIEETFDIYLSELTRHSNSESLGGCFLKHRLIPLNSNYEAFWDDGLSMRTCLLQRMFFIPPAAEETQEEAPGAEPQFPLQEHEMPRVLENHQRL